MDSTDPRRLEWLRAQAHSLGTNPEPVSEARKAWLRRRALDAGYQPSAPFQAELCRDLVGVGILSSVVIIGTVLALMAL